VKFLRRNFKKGIALFVEIVYNNSTQVVKNGAKWSKVVRNRAGKEQYAMLASVYRHSVDAKKRLFIPAKYREELGEKFFITRSLRDKCLIVYSEEEWNKYVAPLEAMPRKEQEKIVRYLYQTGTWAEPDSQGRVLLNDDLIRHAGLTKGAVISGCGKYAEIWAEEVYDALEEDVDSILEALDKYGL
jgi:MraZ protein